MKIQKTVLLFLFVAFYTCSYAQKERNEIDEKYKWNVYDLYESDEAWAKAKAALELKLDKIVDFKGKIGESAQTMLNYFKFDDEISKEGMQLYIYASLKSDVDVGNQENMARVKEIRQTFVEYGQKASFIRPELVAIPKEKVEGYFNELSELAPYKIGMENLWRMKEHTLSSDLESLMAKTGLISPTAHSVFSVFSNAEMPWPTVKLSDGTEIKVNQANYGKYRASSNRADRELVFDAFWKQYKKFQGTYGEMLNGQIKLDVFNARARNYNSALEASLKPNNVPTSVYSALVDNVNANLETFQRYLSLKKRMMGIDTLKYSDLYASSVKGVELKFNYEEAQELILESLEPLGSDYQSVVKKAFDSRWIDVYPNPGKQTGAYSNGGAYNVHPYILMNYNDLYEDVSTLTHELGHTMHSYYSNKTQPFAMSNYAIFVAEVASTFNEVLLNQMMLEKITDKGQKLSLLMSMLDGFKGTLFRQTQFAEYELKMHEAAEKGQPLTGKFLSELYLEVVRKYYGHDKGICYVDDMIEMEWAFIPHFYYNFYVFQYSTSFVASQALAAKVLQGEKGAKEKYMKFLSAGGSDYPINILKNAGIDMNDSEPFDKAIANMNAIMDEIEELLD